MCVDPFNGNTLYVGADLGVWRSIDGGASWALYNNLTLPYVAIGDMHYYKPDSTLRVGTYGRGYWRIKTFLPISGIKETVPTLLEWSVYPNPLVMREEYQAVVNLRHDGTAKFKVYNSVGVLLEEKQLTLLKGQNKVLFNAPSSSGVYFIYFEMETETRHSKIIVTE